MKLLNFLSVLLIVISTTTFADEKQSNKMKSTFKLPKLETVKQYPDLLKQKYNFSYKIGNDKIDLSFRGKLINITTNSILNILIEGEGVTLLTDNTTNGNFKIRVYGERSPISVVKWFQLYLRANNVNICDVKPIGKNRIEAACFTTRGNKSYFTVEKLPGYIFMASNEFSKDNEENSITAFIPVTSFLAGLKDAGKIAANLTKEYSVKKTIAFSFKYDPANWEINIPTNGLHGEVYRQLFRKLGDNILGFMRVDAVDMNVCTNMTYEKVLSISMEEYAESKIKDLKQVSRNEKFTVCTGTRDEKKVAIFITSKLKDDIVIVISLLTSAEPDAANELLLAQNRAWFMLLIDTLKFTKQ
jgi:hypothetical protein